jgi:hypothetical protein
MVIVGGEIARRRFTPSMVTTYLDVPVLSTCSST